VPLEDGKAWSWWEYQAILWNNNDRLKPDGEEEAEAPDAGFVDRIFERLEMAGLVTGSVH
jgi:hypothetical protein